MSILSQLAHFTANLQYDDLSESSIISAKNCFFDTYGVMLMGSSEENTQKLQIAFKENRSTKNGVQVIGSQLRVDPAAAAFLNAFAAHVYDYDDSCYAGMTHPSAVFVPVLLALGQYRKSSGKDIITAFIAGWEVSGRIGLALPSLLHNGWQCASLFGSIGAVAAAARLLNLSEEQTLHSISLLICQIGGIRQSNGTKGKPFTLAKAAENAVTACLSAECGVQGSPQMLEGPQGYFKVFCSDTQDLKAFENIGRPLIIDSLGVCVKKHPICSSAHAAVEAAEALLAQHNFSYDNIESIQCDTTEIVLQYLTYPYPKNPIEAQFSLPYLICTTLYHGTFNSERDLSFEVIKNTEIQKLMSLVKWTGSKTIGPDQVSQVKFPEGAMLTIQLKGGQKYSHCIYDPEGFPNAPMTEKSLISKFKFCSKKVLSEDLVKEFANKTFNLHEVQDVNQWVII